MKQVILQENLKPVSTIGIGCMRIASMNEKEADTFIHTALDASINFFDEADIPESNDNFTVYSLDGYNVAVNYS